MSTIGNYDSNSISTLFSSLSTNNTSSSSTSSGLYGISLTDYASIKNGSYSKLMKSYYALDEDETSSGANGTKDSASTLKSIQSASNDLRESAADLYTDKSLYTADENGEYDMETLYDKVKTFIDNYNNTLDTISNSETDSVATAGANLINLTNTNADMLANVGITINSDYSLSIDEDDFKSARISDVSSLFSGVGSYAYQVGAKATRIEVLTGEKAEAAASSKSGSVSASTSTSSDSASTLAKVLENANALVSSGTDLYKNRNLFDTINGKYDTEAIVDAISSFVDAYNETVSSAEKSSSSSVSSALSAMTGITDEYTKDLLKLGITKDKDGLLSFDKEGFLNADMSKAEDIFTGTGSYAYQVVVKATMLVTQAETEASKSNTYTDSAIYSNNYNTGTIFNGTV